MHYKIIISEIGCKQMNKIGGNKSSNQAGIWYLCIVTISAEPS
jgi:hypothetical protein